MRKIAVAFAMMLSTATFALAGETSAPTDAKVYFINLKDGDIVTSPVTIRFGLSGMGIAPAGTEIPNTGHHHLIIDAKIEGEALNEAIRRRTSYSFRQRPDRGHGHPAQGRPHAAARSRRREPYSAQVAGDV